MADFKKPVPEDLQECLSWPSFIVNTAIGKIEISDRGEGPILFCVHGGPGGCDQSLLLGELFRVNGFRIIGVSRPGYLRTPLESGPAIYQQADLFAALLDVLGLERVSVLGVSAGGPSSYMFAVKYPNRVNALIEIDSICRNYSPNITPLEQKLFLTPAGMKLNIFFADHFPKTALKSLLQAESTLDRKALEERVEAILNDPLKRSFFVNMIHSLGDRFSERRAGVLNDLEKLACLGDLPLGEILCPSMIIHGCADKDVSPEQARFAAASICDSRLEWVKHGSHLGFWLAETSKEVQKIAVEWLLEQNREVC